MSRTSPVTLCASALAAATATSCFSPNNKVRVTSTRYRNDPYVTRVMPATPPAAGDADAVSSLVAAFRGLCTPMRAMKAGNVAAAGTESSSIDNVEPNFFGKMPSPPKSTAAAPIAAAAPAPVTMQEWFNLTAFAAAAWGAQQQQQLQQQQMQQQQMQQQQQQQPMMMMPQQPMSGTVSPAPVDLFDSSSCAATEFTASGDNVLAGVSTSSIPPLMQPMMPMQPQPMQQQQSPMPQPMPMKTNVSHVTNDFFDSTTFASDSNHSSGADVISGGAPSNLASIMAMGCDDAASSCATAATDLSNSGRSKSTSCTGVHKAPSKPEVTHWATVRFKHEACVFRAPFRVAVGDTVFVEADRGEHCGVVTSIATKAPKFAVPNSIVRRAGSESIEALQRLRAREEVTTTSIKKLSESVGLGIRVRDVEFQADGHKLTIFFESKAFVDFRKLQRILFREHKCRIWLVNWNEVDRVMQPMRD